MCVRAHRVSGPTVRPSPPVLPSAPLGGGQVVLVVTDSHRASCVTQVSSGGGRPHTAEHSTRYQSGIDTGDQFIDTASQSSGQRRRVLQVKLMLEINSSTRRLNLWRNVSLRLNLTNCPLSSAHGTFQILL